VLSTCEKRNQNPQREKIMSQTEMLTTPVPDDAASGPTLRQRLRKVEAAYTRRSLLLIAPLLLFVIVSFLFPIASIWARA
jgi:putative spermidine/putrescine transport system permease protein